MNERISGPFIATINAVLKDGKHSDIIAIAVVEDEHEGELWFGQNKPEDGTQVDYVLHNIEAVFAAPDLLEGCYLGLSIARWAATINNGPTETKQDIKRLEEIIAEAEK
jgi:hypothetical protein